MLKPLSPQTGGSTQPSRFQPGEGDQNLNLDGVDHIPRSDRRLNHEIGYRYSRMNSVGRRNRSGPSYDQSRQVNMQTMQSQNPEISINSGIQTLLDRNNIQKRSMSDLARQYGNAHEGYDTRPDTASEYRLKTLMSE